MALSWQEIWELRSRLYRFFGNCLLEPIRSENVEVLSQQFWLDFPCEAANEQMKSGLKQVLNCLVKLKGLEEKEVIEEVMVEYTSLFLGPGRPKAPLWESVYRTPEGVIFGPSTYAVREAMQQDGFETRGKNRQPEDHLGLELMFLAAVSEKIADSQVGSRYLIIQKQIHFIDEHLLSWINQLSKDANLHGDIGFYGGLIELIWGVLLWDKELLREYLESENLIDCLN
ncbi:MAG: molecular chaperone TorD family protein [Bacillota bacterium]